MGTTYSIAKPDKEAHNLVGIRIESSQHVLRIFHGNALLD